MTMNTTGPDDLRWLADGMEAKDGRGLSPDYLRQMGADWDADRAALNSETNRADAAELRAAVLEQRDETETMNIGAALFAVALKDDTGAGEMPAGPCADVLEELRDLRKAWALFDRWRDTLSLFLQLEQFVEGMDAIMTEPAPAGGEARP